MHAARLWHFAAHVLLPVIVGLAGAWFATSAFDREVVPMGPFRVELRAGFGRSVTDIALPPLGAIHADTHRAPIRITATLRSVDVNGLKTYLQSHSLDDLTAEVQQQLNDEVPSFIVRFLGIGLAGGLVLGLLAFRLDRRRVLACGLAAFVAVGGSEAAAAITFRPQAFLSPSYSGTLSLAPQLFGPIESTVERVGYFRTELERIVDAGSRAYAAVEANPLGRGDEIRVLHISDIHLSPLGYDFAQQLASSFGVDFVIDTGDITSFGTPAEDVILNGIPPFHVPYVYVRGSHDSRELQSEIANISNAIVLDGDTTTVDGITIYGLGDPFFVEHRGTPQDPEVQREVASSVAPRILADVQALPRPPDIVAVHDNLMAQDVAGYVPLVVSGHYHVNSFRQQDGTIFLQVGTTGGAGPTGFTAEGNVPLSAEILYFQPGRVSGTPSLVAWDTIRQDQSTGSLSIDRHLVDQEFGSITPSPPAPTPTLTPTESPSPSSS